MKRDINCILDILIILEKCSDGRLVEWFEFASTYDTFADTEVSSELLSYNVDLLCDIKAVNIISSIEERIFDSLLLDCPGFNLNNYKSIEYADEAKTIPTKGYYEIRGFSLSWLGHNLKDFLSAIKKQMSKDLNVINFYDSNLIATYGNTQVYKSLF